MPKSKTSSKRKRPPTGDIRTVVDTVLQDVLMDAWEQAKEVIEATAEDGAMADIAGADRVPVLLAFLHEHEDLARALFGSGFMACMAIAGSSPGPEEPAPAAYPTHGAGAHRTVGRA